MNKTKSLSILFFLLVLCSFVFAVKPTQSNAGLNGLELRVGIFDPIKQNRDMMFNVHIFNGLDGLGLRDPTVVNCSFHLYNESGNHLLTEWSETFDDVWDLSLIHI